MVTFSLVSIGLEVDVLAVMICTCVLPISSFSLDLVFAVMICTCVLNTLLGVDELSMLARYGRVPSIQRILVSLRQTFLQSEIYIFLNLFKNYKNLTLFLLLLCLMLAVMGMIVLIMISLSPVHRVLAPGSAHARPSTRPPIDTSGNFPAHMSAESPSNISPNPSEVISKVSEP